MGLDMFLYKRDLRRSNGVGIDCCYWRKANAIHGWFVDNCQGGEDNCEFYPVSGKQLKALLDLCIKVKLYSAGPVRNIVHYAEYAEELLPTRCGFFFGNISYNDTYLYDIDITINQLSKLDFSKDYLYRSSW